MNRRTGRTEGVYVKVSKRTKSLIEEQQRKGDLNISKWFERAFNLFFLKKADLVQKIYELESNLKLYKTALNEAEKEERIAEQAAEEENKIVKELTLEPLERDTLIDLTTRFNNVNDQYLSFVTFGKRKLSFEQFLKLKEVNNVR